MTYLIRKTERRPALDGRWASPVWQRADTLEITHFRPEGSDHRPVTRARLLYDGLGIYVIFNVQDQFVRCVSTTYQGAVYKDACVEFFVQPKPETGYFNFEMNCGGTLLLKYIEDATRTPEGFAKATAVPQDLGSLVRAYHSMPATVDPEIQDPVEWCVEYVVPFELLEDYVGTLCEVAGQTWRGNFYKCAEANSHPHYGSWSPVTGALNFHQPDQFAPLQFER